MGPEKTGSVACWRTEPIFTPWSIEPAGPIRQPVRIVSALEVFRTQTRVRAASLSRHTGSTNSDRSRGDFSYSSDNSSRTSVTEPVNETDTLEVLLRVPLRQTKLAREARQYR